MTNLIDAIDGDAAVPGGSLRYRLAGRAGSGPVVVFENGWGSSFPYAFWLEEALAPHVRLLRYDHAGIGESQRSAPPTTAALTQQLLALLDHLKIETPVVVAGHSHGGLMAALHAAQAPKSIRAIVQIDPTPEFDDPHMDRLIGLVPLLVRYARLRTRLGLRDPLLSELAGDLPPEVAQRVLLSSCAPASRSAALDELKLLPAIRAAIGVDAGSCPRLIISAAGTNPVPSRLQRLLGAEAAQQRTVAVMQRLHRRQAALNEGSRWETLPYNHGDLITKPAGAAAVAARILDFVR